MRQDVVAETVDLVKEGRIELTFLFHSDYFISQCCFYKKNMIPYALNVYDFLLVLRFHEKMLLQPKNVLNPCHVYQSLTCETAINTDFSKLLSLKHIYVKYKNAILSLTDSFFRT